MLLLKKQQLLVCLAVIRCAEAEGPNYQPDTRHNEEAIERLLFNRDEPLFAETP